MTFPSYGGMHSSDLQPLISRWPRFVIYFISLGSQPRLAQLEMLRVGTSPVDGGGQDVRPHRAPKKLGPPNYQVLHLVDLLIHQQSKRPKKAYREPTQQQSQPTSPPCTAIDRARFHRRSLTLNTIRPSVHFHQSPRTPPSTDYLPSIRDRGSSAPTP